MILSESYFDIRYLKPISYYYRVLSVGDASSLNLY